MGADQITTESQRRVVTEIEILAQACPTCRAIAMTGCKNKNRMALTHTEGSTELAFHRSRILLARSEQIRVKFNGVLSSTDKALITYYAFVMLADAVAANSEKMFSKKMTSQEVQTFFAECAITELQKDKLLEPYIH